MVSKINYIHEDKERLLNPKSINVDLDMLPIVNIEGVNYRVLKKEYTHIDNGSCQCYKDCDCSSRKGVVTITKTTWYRNVKFDNTDKCFYSIPYTQKEY